MKQYEMKRGHFKNVAGDKLMALVNESFGGAQKQDEKIIASFGALERLTVWTDGKHIFVDTVMKTDVPNDVAQSTVGAYNRFLERVTGFTSKERVKRAKKEVEG